MSTPDATTATTIEPAQPELKEVKVPDYLYWYIGASVLVCVVVFFLLPVILKSKSRPVPTQAAPPEQETTDADRD